MYKRNHLKIKKKNAYITMQFNAIEWNNSSCNYLKLKNMHHMREHACPN